MEKPVIKIEGIEKYIFVLLFLISAAPVWVLPYFLTADGPCHLYNAVILNKWLHGQGAYFHQFFNLNTVLFPNWFSHAFLVLLLQFFSHDITAKLIISTCLFCFAFGFRYYISAFTARQSYLSLWVFPFLWQMVMLMGFYNYMFSIAIYFWIIGYWFRHRNNMSWLRILVMMFLCTLDYFMHVFGVLLTLMTITLISISDVFNPKNAWQFCKIFIPVIPALALTAHYILPASDFVKVPFKTLWGNLRSIFTIQNMTEHEARYAKILALIIGASTALALMLVLIKHSKQKEWRVPLLLLIFTLGFYFRGNGQALGGGYILERLESLNYLFAIIFIASVPLPRYFFYASTIAATVLSCLFVYNRMHSFKEASNMVTDVRTIAPFINDHSVILPLKYTDFPTDTKGHPIAPKIYYFAHIMETIELKKDVVYLEDYEGFTHYFPLDWKDSISPYLHLCNGYGFESAPPTADLVKYNNTVVPVKYVIVYGDKVPTTDTSLAGSLSKMIDDNYYLSYTTPVYHFRLYTLKPNHSYSISEQLTSNITIYKI
ncbi:MAG: hypothetical protein WCG87_08040 [Bacteroidota bacterium]